ncbi:hypothetical protein D5086_013425 [Populus alba]|uniref:Uncharacterized protein n=1 Tax=Populus alba TaxID=43335 RepID=A0ACC4C5K9_POPAL
MNLLKQSSTSAIAHAAISTRMLPSRRGAPFIDMDTTQRKVMSFLLTDKTWLAFSSLRNGIYNRDTVLVLLDKVQEKMSIANLKGGKYNLEKNKMNRIPSLNLPEACLLFTAVCAAHSVNL